MGAIDNFLRRFGYAKLDRYGLMLTGDDRVLSTRPAVLDDGLGSKIVGWLDDDLAAMELDHFGVPKAKAPAKPVAAPASLHNLPPAPPIVKKPAAPPMPVAAQVVAPAARLPGLPPVAPVAVAPPIAVAPIAPIAVAAPVEPPKVADEPVVEDEWEWEIAMARARAVALDVQEAADSIATAVTAPKKRRTSPGLPAVRAKTEPPVRSMPRPVAPMEQRKTVIPVPAFQAAAKPSDLRPYNPSQPPRRMPRGTGPVTEDTVRTMAAPANEDRTSPYVTLPNEVKPVGYAHTKRVAAKQR